MPVFWRLLACGLVAWLYVASQRAYKGVLADQLGTPADIEFLRELRSDRFARMAFVPVTRTPLNQWFQGPLFLYYTDRPVSIAQRPSQVRHDDKLLVLRYRDRQRVAERIERWADVRLVNEKCGARICGYDVESLRVASSGPIELARP